MQPTESPLREYLQILRRQWQLVLLVPVVAMLATIVVLGLQKPTYRAATTLVVGEPRGAEPPVLGSHSVTRTVTTLLQSDFVARSVIRDLGLEVSREGFQERLSVGVLPDTSVLDVSYTSTSRKEARDVVNDIAQIFTRKLDETLGVTGGPSTATGGAGSFDLIVRVFDPPHVVRMSEARTSYVAFAGLAGLVLGFLLAVGREALSSPIQRRKDAEEWFGAPVVGTLPHVDGRPPGVGGGWLRRDAERVASLDLLRARLQFAQIGVVGPTIMVTSAGSEVDTSPVAASLGAALTWAGIASSASTRTSAAPAFIVRLACPATGPVLSTSSRRASPWKRRSSPLTWSSRPPTEPAPRSRPARSSSSQRAALPRPSWACSLRRPSPGSFSSSTSAPTSSSSTARRSWWPTRCPSRCTPTTCSSWRVAGGRRGIRRNPCARRSKGWESPPPVSC